MTIVRKGAAEVEVDDGARGMGRSEETHHSEAGGLTQFGVHVVTLQPGARSSDRHWHAHSDEFLLMLEGEAVVIEEDGPHAVGPGDAACWPAGAANGHQVVNRSDAPCSFLVIGARLPRDVIHYPDLGRVLHIDGPAWRMVDQAGALLREGRDA